MVVLPVVDITKMEGFRPRYRIVHIKPSDDCDYFTVERRTWWGWWRTMQKDLGNVEAAQHWIDVYTKKKPAPRKVVREIVKEV